MPYIVSSKEMKKADLNTTDYYGVPQLVLMERAALETMKEISALYPDAFSSGKRFVIAAGNGNNGGDGAALARLMLLAGQNVSLWVSGNEALYSEALRKQLEIYNRYKGICSLYTEQNLSELRTVLSCADILIDSLFGIGLSRNIEEPFTQLIHMMNEAGGIKVSLDIPSGISSDTGQIMGAAFRADLTVTYSFRKRGCLLYPGKEMCGLLKTADIGIPDAAFIDQMPLGYTFSCPDDLHGILPKRLPAGNKGTFGKVLLIAGSAGMPGAAILAAGSALRSGSGMVKVLTEHSVRSLVIGAFPEVMVDEYDCYDDLEELFLKNEKWADAIVIGPGLGKGKMAVDLLKLALEKSVSPLLIDADALNILAEDSSLYRQMIDKAENGRIIVCTPHMAELAHLLHVSLAELQQNRFSLLDRFCRQTGCMMVSKDAATIVYYSLNDKTCRYYINQTGNSGMATAGSGDVLSGLLGALLAGLFAQNDINRAVFGKTMSAGVYYHGLAGNYAAEELGEISMTAGDLIRHFPNAFKQK